jgi:VWFA-related protein
MTRAHLARGLALATSCAVTGAAQEREPPRFPIDVERVRVDVFVGRGEDPLAGLAAADFEVRDDGRLQEVRLVSAAETPVHAVLALDVSESVAGPRLDKLRAAAEGFLAQLGPADRATLITFSHELTLIGDAAGEPAALAGRLSDITSGGSTSLNDAMAAALVLADPDVGRGVVVVFSDGLDMLSWTPDQEVVQLARHAGAVVYAVSPDREGRTDLLEALGGETGGRVFTPRVADDLRDSFLRILNEFRSRYLLEFEPSSSKPGWHRLDVRVKGRRADVRARRGYSRLARPGE